MTSFRHILVPTDFGDAALCAADLACGLADPDGGRMTLLHVWTIPLPAYAEAIIVPVDEMKAGAERALELEAGRLRARFPRVEKLLIAGVAWRSIVDAVEEQKFDLVVVGTHGLKGIQRFLLGSVAEKVVRSCPVPVLSVHATDPA